METRNRLEQMIQADRLPHALMLTGDVDRGLEEALWLAARVNRWDETPSSLLSKPDLHFAYPIAQNKDAGVTLCGDVADKWNQYLQEGGYTKEHWQEVLGAGAKQLQIYEKESGEIVRKLSVKPFGDGYKVMVVWQVDKMNVVCQNKLLKLLEEPPQMTLFILVTDAPEMLLTTIRSRVQELPLRALTGEQQWSKRWQEMPDEMQHMHEQFTKMMQNAWMVGNRSATNPPIKGLLALRDWVNEEIAGKGKSREEQKAYLEYCQRQIRENMVRNLALQATTMAEPEAVFAEKFARFITPDRAERMMTELEKAQRQIEQNGNAKMIFFDLCLQLALSLKGVSK